MKSPSALFLSLILPVFLFAQEAEKQQPAAESGQFSLGMRNTLSLFGESNFAGLGYGGQFRIRMGKKLNTEWYADWITTDIGGLGKREDGHIGWSVMFYPTNLIPEKGKLSPYLLAGHCFDYTKLTTNWMPSQTASDKDRYSTAVQMGLGANYMLGERTDVSLSAQYMNHLGNSINTEKKTNETTGQQYLLIKQEKTGLALEGHLLVTLSLNVMIADFKKNVDTNFTN